MIGDGTTSVPGCGSSAAPWARRASAARRPTLAASASAAPPWAIVNSGEWLPAIGQRAQLAQHRLKPLRRRAADRARSRRGTDHFEASMVARAAALIARSLTCERDRGRSSWRDRAPRRRPAQQELRQVLPSSGYALTPMLMVGRTTTPSLFRSDVRRRKRGWSRRPWRRPRLPSPGKKAANSSPPKRLQAAPCGDTTCPMILPTSAMVCAPMGWPWVSLISLSPSRSSISTANGARMRRASSTART